MKFILRSPLHVIMSASTMLITVTGRKTGRPITTPINYASDLDGVWVISKRDRTWWRNLRDGAQVTLQLRGQKVIGFAELILDPERVVVQLPPYIQQLPYSARSLGIKMEAGKPNVEDMVRVAGEWLFIHIKCEREGAPK